MLGPVSGERLAKNIALVIQKDLRHAVIFNKGFQQASGLDEMDDEQARDMVQTLTMSGLSMVYLMLETGLESIKNPEQRELYSEARNSLISAYLNLLNGNEELEDILPGWVQALAQYCEGYRQIYQNEKEHLPDIRLHNPWVNIVGIGAAVRMRNDLPSSEDPLPEVLINIFGEMSGRIVECIVSELKRI